MLEAEWRDIAAIIISIAGATVLSLILYRRTSPTLPLRLRLIFGILRWLAACLVLLLVTDPVLHLARTRYGRPTLAVLIDDSRSMAYPDAREKFDLVKAALSEDVVERLGSKADLRFLTFSDRAIEVLPGEIPNLEPKGSRTDLAHGLKSAAEGVETKPSAYVVVSDGAVNFGEDVLHLASSLRIPIHTVSVAADSALPDISIDAIEVTETAYANTEVPVSVMVSGRHAGQAAVALTISDSLGSVVSEPVSIPPTGAKTRVQARVDAGETGKHDFVVTLSPLEGEQVTTNNSATFSLRVVKGKIAVCIVAEHPSWDYAFAKRSLEVNPNFDVTTWFTSAGTARIKMAGIIESLESEIPELDAAVVLGDATLGSAQDKLREFIWDGGGVLFVSGNPATGPRSEMSPFLPSVGPRGGGQLFRPAVTDDGTDHPILRQERVGGLLSWSDLPPVPVDVRVGNVRREAMTLLSGLNGEVTTPLLAVMRYGRGRIVGFSASDLWRWDFVPKGFGVEASPFAELLTNSIGWLTESEEIKRLSLSTSKNAYLWGEPVDLFARVYDENLRPVSDAVVEAILYDEFSGEIVRQSGMTDRGGGSYVARLDFLPASGYVATVEVLRNDESYAQERTGFVIDSRGLEDFAFQGDRTLLEELARVTGGLSYDIDEVDDLASDLNPGMVILRSSREIRLRLTLITFLVLVGLLGVEWFFRKRRMLL